MKLTAVGSPGHGSRPHEDNSAVHLLRALVKLQDWERGITYTPETTAYLERLADAGLMPPVAQKDELEAAIKKSPQLLAQFMNTLNITMLNSGIKANVIPAKSEATIDCRLLPGMTKERWRELVIERIGDERIEVEFFLPQQGSPQAIDWDTELYRTIESVVKGTMEEAIVTPAMTIGGTDNRFLRERGIPAYGFIPCLLSPAEAAGFHGNDEFMTIDNFNMGVELTYEIVRRMCV
jgi:acetylornithine deacetylase/succinyl-diaminopimelate desuccinylase-like protein